ncbi:DUF6578 domain-containing protein [Microbacterium sp. ZW T5_45]|uniref:DUF6578 domain-containing protein n=1 Tax=Microbacterium sp. ZW T5_45 TaxID=3378080 RepID=UPI0038522A70
MRIWLSSWEWECCGTPFEVGSEVALSVRFGVSEWVADALGPELAETVDAEEMHHEDMNVQLDLDRRSGVVTAIAEVRLTRDQGHPVPGSAQVSAAPRVPWHEEGGPGQSGFLVDIDRHR